MFAFLSYPLLFVKFPVTRDFPWANLLLFVVAAILLFIGVRRGFAAGSSRASKIGAAVAMTLGALVIALFLFSIFVLGRWIPASTGAPKLGQKAPDFTLTDVNGKAMTLSDLLSSPINGAAPKGVLLVFYRGYW